MEASNSQDNCSAENGNCIFSISKNSNIEPGSQNTVSDPPVSHFKTDFVILQRVNQGSTVTFFTASTENCC